ncbi:uncharacterized protein LY89DRAFT_714670 [Mollisia scopiformis]|uniref:DUF4220 domain-containing protein n=1 Tax=Mollisia scopiformis TaxID=149040 RepID=A0A194XN61_MOLSC|nr:uncharacterized protein LY89DRAFT_714670 [Mollisia scopiformis]KUJ21576.1 hypothetical protein LY89DRAFT_714670 [Mollisia scopiformis]
MSLLFSTLYFFSATAAPVTNLTALQRDIAPSWVPDPAGRGTWSLLYSCLFTLLLCVYTAIHLNVPPPNDTRVKFWLRKTKWVGIAIFAPELVVYTAFEQWLLAKRFLKDINEAFEKSTAGKDQISPPPERDAPSKPPFDMVYAHYAVMGGFAADVSNMHNTLRRVTFTTDGILFLAKHGRFLETSRINIQDKSKADTLAKGLVCFQVLWIVGQAIERKVAGYPVTLLEVHTIVHVVCVIVMYGLWIRKPLNVQDPTVIDFRDRLDLLAYMLQVSSPHHGNLVNFRYKRRHRDKITTREPTFLWWASPQSVSSEVREAPNEVVSTPDETQVLTKYDMTSNVANIAEEYTPRHDSKVVCRLISGQALPCGLGPDISSVTSLVYLLHPRDRICAVSLSQADIDRLNLTAKFIIKVIEGGYDPFKETRYHDSDLTAEFYKNTTTLGMFSRDASTAGILALRSQNYDGSFLHDINSDSAYLASAMALIPTAYGCVHLGALSIIFPTTIERLLWKASCYYLIATAGVTALISLVIFANNMRRTVWRRHRPRPNNAGRRDHQRSSLDIRIDNGIGYAILGFLGTIAFLYVCARLYIVIESFVSLRHVPIGVYKTPSLNIMGNIPHL